MDDTKPVIQLRDCWAKTDPVSGQPCLSVQDHCLVVGAVAERLERLLSPACVGVLPGGAITLVAAHDIGKLTPGFQLKTQNWKHYDTVFSETIHNGLCSSHALISQKHLSEELKHLGRKEAAGWCVSTGGHHGKYPCGLRKLGSRMGYEGGNESFSALRGELLDTLIQVFGPLPEDAAKGEVERIHFLTGFTIFADWIGSNTDWFPEDHSIDRRALGETADRCLERILWKASPRVGLSFGELFNPKDPSAFTPRGIQSTLLEAVDSPGLYIVEAPMGLGKTEAALAAAYHRWTCGEEQGIYFALPTQLTSNKIHERVEDFLREAVGERYVNSLVHGSAWLAEDSRRLRQVEGDREEANDEDDALLWYSNAKRKLLAPFGTGTIDQALLAVLPAKHAALRYFALAGKVVVIDEVHSYDAYMTALIKRLVRYLIKSGSSVIILSATLTAAQRRELVQAAEAEEEGAPLAYPLITKVVAGSKTANHIEVPCDLEDKAVRIENCYNCDDDAYWQSVAEAVERGANVVVIRNTVALAQETFLRLKSQFSAAVSREHIGLLHSRFPQCERDRNERKWTELLGKDHSKRPQGSLLVATQVVEQSVDIDADLLVTDIAPVDLILQRIGRLHRHDRPRPEGFDRPLCQVLHPLGDWSGSAKEIKKALSPHSFIYRPLELWRAFKVLSERDSICLPGEIRSVLEEAYGLYPDSDDEVYEFVDESNRELLNKIAKVANRDVFNAHAIEDCEGRETRDGIKPTAHLVLFSELPMEQGGRVEIVFDGGERFRLRVGEFSFPLAKALSKRAIRVPQYLVERQLKEAPDWLSAHLENGVFAICVPDDTRLSFPGAESSGYAIRYRPDLGVSHEKEAFQMEPTNEEDFWY